MPGPLLFGAGVVTLLLLAVDAAWTTLWADRSGGPVSSRLMARAWRYATRVVGSRHVLLSLFAPSAIALVLMVWVVLLWLGWFLIFSADDSSVVRTTTSVPGSGFDRFYFVGYTIFTLGNGDFAPNGPLWQFLTVIASASGLVLVSLAITYLVSVLSAVVNKRTFASRVHAIGESPERFVVNAWDGDFAGLDLLLTSLGADLARLSTQHLAYPIIHFYHPVERRGSSAVAIATLDEAVTLLSVGVAPGARPSRAILRSVRRSVDAYLSTLAGGSVTWAQSAPPLADLGPLRSAGIPTADDDDYRDHVESASERRRKVAGLVESDQWSWAD